MICARALETPGRLMDSARMCIEGLGLHSGVRSINGFQLSALSNDVFLGEDER